LGARINAVGSAPSMLWQEVLKLNSLLLSSLAIERAGPGARLFQFKKSKWIGRPASLSGYFNYEYTGIRVSP